MDISPPIGDHNGSGVLLHRITLPFEVAVYGVGNTDSLFVHGVILDGTPYEIDPATVRWSIRPFNTLVSLDSVGRLQIHAETSQEFTIIASYTVDAVTKADTAKLYVTEKTYDIESFRLTALDSARVGVASPFSIWSLTPESISPKVRLDIFDREGQGIEIEGGTSIYKKIFTRFMRDYETGARVGNGLNAVYLSTTDFVLVSPVGIPVRPYWFGLSTYLYGQPYRDSIQFTSLPPAVVMLLASESMGRLEVTTQEYYAQPCAVFGVQNGTNDTLVVELSKSTADRECGGVLPNFDTRQIPPGTMFPLPWVTAFAVTSLGYDPGQSITWTVRRNGAIQDRIQGEISIK